MICEFLRLVEQSKQHELVLQILIRHICDCSLNIEDVVDHFVDHSPGRSILLNGRSVFCCDEGQNHG